MHTEKIAKSSGDTGRSIDLDEYMNEWLYDVYRGLFRYGSRFLRFLGFFSEHVRRFVVEPI